MRLHRSASSRARQPTSLAFWGVVAAFFASHVSAQYVYDPNAADEQGPPSIRYFGAAKDDKGTLLPGTTILLESAQLSFVLVTDEQGRFRANLPLELVAEKVSPKCSKPGFSVVRVTKRAGPEGVKPTVQVDCVLRAASKG
jgi:hypothetical protein